MVTRRTFLGTLSLAACSTYTFPRGFSQGLLHAADTSSSDDVTRYVNLIIGTGGHGHCFPGATVPFGAVQLSPDTYDDGWDHVEGYAPRLLDSVMLQPGEKEHLVEDVKNFRASK